MNNTFTRGSEHLDPVVEIFAAHLWHDHIRNHQIE